jgi:peptidoglycan/LPS O-acetylase OafA/YrhL
MVDLFFVLSGFVLAPIFPKFKEWTFLKEFALNRFLRLAPLTWITILFVILYASLLEIKQSLSDEAVGPSMSLDFKSVGLSLLLMQVFSHEATLLNYPLWSLSAEWIVNISIALAASFFPRKTFLKFLAGLLVLGIICAKGSVDFEWVNQISRAAFGISLGLLIRHLFDRRKKLKAQKAHLFLSVILSFATVFLNFNFYPYRAIFSSCIFAYLIYSLAEFELGTNFRVPKSLASNCGSLSFGIYVWHAPLSGLVNRLLEILKIHNLGISYLALVIISTIATLISVNLVEKPLLKTIKGRLELR